MKIIVVRHGETDWNLRHSSNEFIKKSKNDMLSNITDSDDISLNENGITQARILKDKLIDYNIDMVFCSPLNRVVQTANIILENRNVPIIFSESLNVRKFGEFKGKVADVDFDFTNGFWSYAKNEHYQEAENIREFFDRVYEFLDYLYDNYNTKSILLVTHGSVTVPIYCYFNEIPKDDKLLKYTLNNCDYAIYNKV